MPPSSVKYRTFSIKEARQLLKLPESSILRLCKTFDLIPAKTNDAIIQPHKIRLTTKQLRFLSAVRQRILKGQSIKSIQQEVMQRASTLKRENQVIHITRPVEKKLPRTGYDALLKMARSTTASVQPAVTPIKTNQVAPHPLQSKVQFDAYKQEKISNDSPIFKKLLKAVVTEQTIPREMNNEQFKQQEQKQSLTFLFPDKPFELKTPSLFIPNTLYNTKAPQNWLTRQPLLKK